METLDKFTKILISELNLTLKSGGLTIALLTALGLILRRRARRSLLITNLNHVGRTEGQKESAGDQFDVIILGGGRSSNVVSFQSLICLIPSFVNERIKVLLVVYLHLVCQRIRLYVCFYLKPVAGNFVRRSWLSFR
jgi:hypothetical protein